MWPMLGQMPRREFLRQGAASIAALSPGAAFLTACHRPLSQASPADAALVRQWASTLRGRVVLPADVAYETDRQVWNRSVDRHPAFIVHCADVQDVQRAVEFGRSHGLLTAVRSGGHSQAGHSTCDGGMIIDVGEMKDIHVDTTNRVARVTAGARVRDLLNATSPTGLATPTGGCPDVGIGGLTLGGGENVLSAKYGMVCDNVVSAQVVTADGRILMANKDQNADLFWAIRGGSGNFGVVTSFEYRLYPLTTLLEGSFSIPLSRARDGLRGYRDYMHSAPDELTTFGVFIPRPQGSVLTIGGSYCGEPANGARAFEQLGAALGSLNGRNVRSVPYAATFVLPAAPSLGSGGFLPNLTDDLAAVLIALFQAAPSGATVLWNDYHGAITRVPMGDAAFPLREPGFSIAAWASWAAPSNRPAVLEWVTRFRSEIRPFTRGVYVNDLDDEGEARAREAYGANYVRLAAIKAKYDPTNFFHLNQNIKPQG
jgi:FAD binding domain-containing protein/berberine-like enzyme